MTARDRRFDGQFVTAVTSTGIYCRPSLPGARGIRLLDAWGRPVPTGHPGSAHSGGRRGAPTRSCTCGGQPSIRTRHRSAAVRNGRATEQGEGRPHEVSE
ncbi:hypothetical protein NSA19_13390 [Actinomyces bowdenii]|uniref:Ada metal-binding domain-containing protein n=1 Tax=Actinomyces bowdenii TaxID=131109 RepID=UPI00214BE052|nr:Ada metal-binding domain-containing protein [Actinomyces bowdenii]MCR2053812.1 hypothetical protein [Actinomyces bowdenii]